jgi:hypothetical protein
MGYTTQVALLNYGKMALAQLGVFLFFAQAAYLPRKYQSALPVGFLGKAPSVALVFPLPVILKVFLRRAARHLHEDLPQARSGSPSS